MQQFYDKLGAEEKMSLCYTGNQNVGDFKCSAHVWSWFNNEKISSTERWKPFCHELSEI